MARGSVRAAVPARSLTSLDARNCVFMGTSVVRGAAKAVVFATGTATGTATEIGRVYRLTAEQPPEPSPLQRQVADMARRVAAIALGNVSAATAASVALPWAARRLSGRPPAPGR